MRFFLFSLIMLYAPALALIAMPASALAFGETAGAYNNPGSMAVIVRIAGDADVRDEDYSEGDAIPGDESDADHLDALFAKLKTESHAASAGRIARQIVGIWNESGSDTINLLMQWSAEAIGRQQYAAAQDLLEQVTTLKPDYAEGWNRRATLYFMMSDYGRSLSDIEQTLRLEPRHFGALSGLAAIFQKTSKNRQALDAWYRVLKSAR
jgi:tetratricopeptide (TPR) repeat protein